MNIYVTHFNNKTFEENKNWKIKNDIQGCVYGSPLKISETILPDTRLIIVEMNNTKNIIEGIGIIKNSLIKEDKKFYKIYSDNNYNRFIYRSQFRIDKSSFNNYEKEVISELEKLIFKSKYHCKRGQGIQKLPKHIHNIEEINFKKFLNNLYINRFIKINKNNLKILT